MRGVAGNRYPYRVYFLPLVKNNRPLVLYGDLSTHAAADHNRRHRIDHGAGLPGDFIILHTVFFYGDEMYNN